MGIRPSVVTSGILDLVVRIEGDRLLTDLYEKPMALYLYISPHSAHAPGGINGLITGQMLRILTLCSDPDRIKTHTLNFLHRLEDRGYNRKDLVPLIEIAAKNARKYLQRSDEERQEIIQTRKDSLSRCVRLHRVFHPDDPSASTIQKLFKETILEPPGKLPLNELENLDQSKIPVDRMMICNHRAPNLGNFLSYRKETGGERIKLLEKVTSYLDRADTSNPLFISTPTRRRQLRCLLVRVEVEIISFWYNEVGIRDDSTGTCYIQSRCDRKTN